MKEGGGWRDREIKTKKLGNLCNNYSWLLVPVHLSLLGFLHSLILSFVDEKNREDFCSKSFLFICHRYTKSTR